MTPERFASRSGIAPEVITNRSASRVRACARIREQGREQGVRNRDLCRSQVQNGSVSYAHAGRRIGLGS